MDTKLDDVELRDEDVELGNIPLVSVNGHEEIDASDHDEHATKSFIASTGLSSDEASLRLKIYGRNELQDKHKPKVRKL